jgi:hypothetical protein
LFYQTPQWSLGSTTIWNDDWSLYHQ